MVFGLLNGNLGRGLVCGLLTFGMIFGLIGFADANPPTHDPPILNSTYGTNYTDENLTCYNQSTNDGTAVKNIYNWYKDNSSIMVLNMPFEGSSNSTYTKDYSGYTQVHLRGRRDSTYHRRTVQQFFGFGR